jgi:hypothetical protein
MSCPKKVAPGTESERPDLPFDRRAADSTADRERSFRHEVEHDGKDQPNGDVLHVLAPAGKAIAPQHCANQPPSGAYPPMAAPRTIAWHVFKGGFRLPFSRVVCLFVQPPA